VYSVVVVGHTHCGGAEAALDGADHATHRHPDPGAKPLTRWLTPLTQLAAELLPPPRPPRDVALQRLIEANVRAQVDALACTRSVKEAWREYDAGVDRPAVWLHGWVYDLETKKLRDLGVSRGPSRAKPRK
jgi:carbonic anhydrase